MDLALVLVLVLVLVRLSFLEIPSREGGGGLVENHLATVVGVLVRQSDESRGVRNLLREEAHEALQCQVRIRAYG